MDKSQQYILRRFSHLSPLFPNSTTIRKSSTFDSLAQPISDGVYPKYKHNPMVEKPVYLMEYEGRTYFSKRYTRFGVLGTHVVFGHPDNLYHKELSFLVSDFLQGEEPLVLENAQPLTWWGIRKLIILNNLRSLISPVFAVIGFLGRVIGFKGFEDALIIYAFGYLYNYFIGLNEISTWVISILFGLTLFINLFNKLKWLRAFAFFQAYVIRRAGRFEEIVDKPYNFEYSHKPYFLNSTRKDSTNTYVPFSTTASQLIVYALVEKLFSRVDALSYPYKATKEDYVKAFSDFEDGYTHLGLKGWEPISLVLEHSFHSKDSLLFADFLQYLGVSSDDEHYNDSLTTLRKLAGYKQIDD